MEKRIILVTVIVTIVTVVGKRKIEDAGMRDRAKEKAPENIHTLSKSNRKCKKYQILSTETKLSGCQ